MTRDEFMNILPGLAKDYKASPEVLQHISNIDLLMIVGASGVGKTSIIKRLGIPYVPADTTRLMRPEEINGTDYFFRTDYDQIVSEIKERKFVQVNVYSTGEFYGTRISAYPEVGFAVYAVVADKVLSFRQLGFNETISAYVTPPTFSEWMDRMGKHNLESEQLSKRLVEAKQSFAFALSDPETHFIINNDLTTAVEQTKSLINGKPNVVLEAKARQAAQKIYDELAFA